MGVLAHERVDLVVCLEEAVDPLRGFAREKGLLLSVVSAPAIVEGDAVLVRQAISNIVRNAIVYNVAGGAVAVRIERGEGRDVVVVNDGPIADPERIPELVKPFVRGKGRSLTRGRGHGLGLAIAKAVMDAHHGRLEMEARPSGGLVVRLSFPPVVA